jgi:dephospho-CoA kinase
MHCPLIGIVGGIGSGKSLVAAELVKRGGYLISGDALGHEALRQPAIKEEVLKRWGRELLDENGEIQRRRLGQKVFADPAELQALEALVFPWIGRRIVEEIGKARRDPAVRLIVLDAAVMMETGWDRNCDRVIYVDAAADVRRQRLLSQRGWSDKEIQDRERSQMPLDEKRRRADAVLDNSGTPARLGVALDELLASWGIS